jgi:hypothetical protein
MDIQALAQFNMMLAAVTRGNGYHARREIADIQREAARDPKRVEPFGFKVYSQGDEDGVIEEIFRRLNISTGTFCEIGVQNGLECNTLYLLHKGWRGSWVEGDRNQMEPIRNHFHSILEKQLGVYFSYVSAENMNEVMRTAVKDPDALDFLSIDIDGNDIWLLDALSYKPKVICIEYNGKFPANLSKKPVYDPTHSWNGTDYMGSSLKALCEVANAKGYRLVGTNVTGANAFFVRNDLAGHHFCQDASAENLYNPVRYHLIFDHYQHIGHRAGFGPYTDLV